MDKRPRVATSLVSVWAASALIAPPTSFGSSIKVEPPTIEMPDACKALLTQPDLSEKNPIKPTCGNEQSPNGWLLRVPPNFDVSSWASISDGTPLFWNKSATLDLNNDGLFETNMGRVTLSPTVSGVIARGSLAPNPAPVTKIGFHYVGSVSYQPAAGAPNQQLAFDDTSSTDYALDYRRIWVRSASQDSAFTLHSWWRNRAGKVRHSSTPTPRGNKFLLHITPETAGELNAQAILGKSFYDKTSYARIDGITFGVCLNSGTNVQFESVVNRLNGSQINKSATLKSAGSGWLVTRTGKNSKGKKGPIPPKGWCGKHDPVKVGSVSASN